MNEQVLRATHLYVTDRKKFEKDYSGDKNSMLVKFFLDEIFLNSESRPDLAEQVALYDLGCKLREGKKGYDGFTKEGRPVEAKVRNFVTNQYGEFPSSQTAHQINDVSQTIIDRYRKDNPLFFFPYFYNGHYAAAFTIDYDKIDPYYTACLTNYTKGRVSFQLRIGNWLEHSKLVHLHKDELIRSYLPRSILAHIRSQITNRSTFWPTDLRQDLRF